VVVPVFNEAGNAAQLVAGILAAVRPLGVPFELIVVDDGSRDGTAALLRGLVAGAPELVVLRLRRNFGQSPALQAGFDRARGEVIVTLDGDLQNDPRDIPRLLERIDAGADVVSGWRVERQDAMVLRKIPSWFANRLIRWVTRVPIHDQGCSLKAYRHEIVERLNLYSDLHRFIAILTMPQGAAIEEIAVRHHPRTAGASKYGISRVLKVVVDLAAIQMLTRFRESPTRWFGMLGLPFLVGSVVAGIASVLMADGLIVFSAVSILLGLSFLSCVFAALLGEVIIDGMGSGEQSRVVAREEQIRDVGREWEPVR
jgi:glycosyltransferase involved in cell wall biosynthesis